MEMAEGSLLQAAGNGSGLASVDEAAVLMTATELGNTDLHIALSIDELHYSSELWRACPTLLGMENNRKETPIHVAASSWDPSILEWLNLVLEDQSWTLEEKRRLLRMPDADGNTALHRLVMRRLRARSAEGVEFLRVQSELVSAMLLVDQELSLCLNNAGETALYLAANVGSIKIVDSLLECPSPPVGNGGSCGRSPLHAAARQGIPEIFEKILDKRPNYIDACDDLGWTPLHYAASLNNEHLATLLLDGGCSIERLSKDGATPVHVAAAMDSVDVLKALVIERPDCLGVLDSRGWNALHVAAHNGRSGVVKFIFEVPCSGALINQRDYDGNTPLQLIRKDEWEMLTLFLLDSRVQLFSENNKGETIADEIGKIPGDSVHLNMLFFHSLLLLAVNFSIRYGQSAYNKRLEEGNKTVLRNMYDWRMKKLAIVATLVATVTFAAGLAAPGGYINSGAEEGLAALGRKPAFRAFVCLDSLAMFLSLIVVGMSCAHAEFVSGYIGLFAVIASTMLDYALLLMAWAFTCGIYAILEHYSRGLVVVICLFCSAYMVLLTVIGSYTVLKLSKCCFQLAYFYAMASTLSAFAENKPLRQ